MEYIHICFSVTVSLEFKKKNVENTAVRSFNFLLHLHTSIERKPSMPANLKAIQ